MENKEIDDFPKTVNFRYNINDEYSIKATCLLFGHVVVVYAYDKKPSIGSMVMKPYSTYPDPPMILFQGKNPEQAIAMATMLSGIIKRGTVVSANIEKTYPMKDFVKKLSTEIIENIDKDNR